MHKRLLLHAGSKRVRQQIIVRGSLSGKKPMVVINPARESKTVFVKSILEAAEITELSNAIANSPARGFVQRVTARRGATLEQNYVRGKTIGDRIVSEHSAKEVARILAGIHAAKIPKSLRKPAIDAISNRIVNSIRELTAHQALSAAEAGKVRGLFRKIPTKSSIAICHMDINKDNVVESGKSVRIIDIMDTKVYFRDFDIAKTIFGLRLSPPLEAKFLTAYQNAGGNAIGFNANRKFWIDLVLLSKLRAADERRRVEKSPLAERKFLRLKKLLLAQ